MSTLPKTFLTPEQYLEIERMAEVKSEYYDGEMFSMSGGTVVHSLLAVNLITLLRNGLKGNSCRPVNSDLRLCANPRGPFCYPDAMIICGDMQFLDSRRDVITNPAVIFEVLSPSTAAFDRGRKFHAYQQIETLREYVLVSQDAHIIERFERQSDNRWLLSMYRGLSAVLELSSVPCTLSLADVYADINIF
ncbi:MAG TPA: Uma2 family endonuclease [Bryobacteraceae bacterium]|nr:Uma2 family endonuclease [Bryobacteraceae bacterium]